MERRYLILIEKGEHNYCASVPDLPGVGVCGDTLEEAKQLIQQAIDMHIEALVADGEAVPEPSTVSDYVITAA